MDQLRTPFIKDPVPAGSAIAKAHINSQFDYVRIAHRFEGGNPNFLGIRVLRAGIQFINAIGLANIEARVQVLTTHCLELMQSKGLKTETPQAWSERAQIINVVVPEAGGLMDVLREKHGVITNVKDDRLRISMSFFNNENDIEKVIGAIAKETGSQ